MSAINTQSTGGRVVADQPGPADTHCMCVWFGPSEDGLHRKQFEGPLLPIEQFDEAVAWARSMAPQMVHSLYVVPLSDVDVLRTEEMQRGIADLTPNERGELRRHIVATIAAIMRDSSDPVVRADAFDVLKAMKVVRP